MKPRLFLLLTFFCAGALGSAEPVMTISEADILAGRARVIGNLSLPVNEYATVEGVPLAPSMGKNATPPSRRS